MLAMNRLSRAKSLACPSPRKCISFLHRITSVQEPVWYSTRTQQSSKPKTSKSLSFTQRVKKEVEALTAWPRPREIPYQAKVANLVNIIGYVKIPVKFEIDPDGRNLAATVISHEQEGAGNSLLIPVVFEGDLAHVVSCHVKENDCVFVSGRLSVDPMRLALNETLGKFHVVVENLNFVEGLKSVEWGSAWKKRELMSSRVEIDEPVNHVAVNIEEINMHPDAGGDNVEKGFEKSGSKNSKGEDSWRDVVINPLQYWDYREHKSNGSVKKNFPDFKHKVTGESLWLDSAPEWVLAGLGKLEFDVKTLSEKKQPPGVMGGVKKKEEKGDDVWRNLVENPDNWWDNRLNKRNPKAPDFKHKETGEVLWLNKLPVWASSQLPPLRQSPNS